MWPSHSNVCKDFPAQTHPDWVLAYCNSNCLMTAFLWADCGHTDCQCHVAKRSFLKRDPKT